MQILQFIIDIFVVYFCGESDMDIFTELRTYSYFIHFLQCTNISRSRTGRNYRTMATAVVTRNGWSLAVYFLQVFWDSLSIFIYKPIRGAMASGRTRPRTGFGSRCVVATHHDARLSQANDHRIRSAFDFTMFFFVSVQAVSMLLSFQIFTPISLVFVARFLV